MTAPTLLKAISKPNILHSPLNNNKLINFDAYKQQNLLAEPQDHARLQLTLMQFKRVPLPYRL